MLLRILMTGDEFRFLVKDSPANVCVLCVLCGESLFFLNVVTFET